MVECACSLKLGDSSWESKAGRSIEQETLTQKGSRQIGNPYSRQKKLKL